MNKDDSDVILKLIFGGVGICLGLFILLFLVPYSVWASSLVLLQGYNWFLADLIGIQFTQIHFAALSSITTLLLWKPKLSGPKDDGGPSKFIGGIIAVLIGPWITLGWLWVLTFFL